MKQLRNEKGAALVLTMMMIVLILLFIMVLFAQVTNTTRQVTTIEKKLTSSHLAEMGVAYYQALVDKTMPDTITDVEEISNISLPNQVSELIDAEGNYSFEILDPELIPISDNQYEITFSSRGISYDKETTLTNITIPIEIQEKQTE